MRHLQVLFLLTACLSTSASAKDESYDDRDTDKCERYNSRAEERCEHANNRGHDKVVVCHKDGHALCVDEHALGGHLNHGDELGLCVCLDEECGEGEGEPSEGEGEPSEGEGESCFCGDDIANEDEQCDGLDIQDADCLAMGFVGGIPTCNIDCTLNVDTCELPPSEGEGEGEGEGEPVGEGEGEGEPVGEGEGEPTEGEGETCNNTEDICDKVPPDNANNEVFVSGSSVAGCSSTSIETPFLALLALLGLFTRRKTLVTGMILSLFCAYPVSASGLNNFDLTPNARDILVTPDATVLQHTEFSGLFFLDYAHDPLILRDSSGAQVGTVVEHQTTLQAGASIGLFDVAEVGLMLPVSYLVGPQLGSSGFGDVRLLGKIKLLETDGFAAALRGEVTLPSSLTSLPTKPFLGERSPTITPAVTITYKHDLFKASGDVGMQVRPDRQLLDLPLTSALVYSAGVEIPVIKDLLAFDGSVYGESSVFQPLLRNSPLEGVVAAKIMAGPAIITVGGGGGIVPGVGAPDARLFVGVGFDSESLFPKPAPVVITPEVVEEQEPEPETSMLVPPPEPPLAKLSGNEIVILQPVFFAFDSDVILEKSYPVLRDVVTVLTNHPEILLMLVEGHTSSEGTNAYNWGLSSRRAFSVRNHLIASGIAPDRLASEGFGEELPIVSNKTKAGRELNRRVQFKVLTSQTK